MHRFPDRALARGRQQAKFGALLFGAAALVTGLGLLASHQPQVDEAGLLAVTAGAAVSAAILYFGGTRLPQWALELVVASGTVLVSLALLFNGERDGGAAGGDELYYLWVVLYAAYYFERRAVLMQVVGVAIAYAVTLAAIDPGPVATSRWLTLIGLIVGAAVVIRLLTERNERLIDELAGAARTDPLTGLANRRGFEEQFARERSRAQRTGEPLSLVMGDLDHFKQVNDQWGHAAGDAVLAEVASILRERLRPTETAARIGGDEFAVLLPETDGPAAEAVASRLAAAVAERTGPTPVPVGLSFGVAVLQPRGGSLDHLMRVADMALYAAKRKQSGEPGPFPAEIAQPLHLCAGGPAVQPSRVSGGRLPWGG